MPLSVSLTEGRGAFDESVTAFVDAVGPLSEWDLLGASRCHGWSRLEVVDHVLAGWQEMLGGFVTAVDDSPTVDAASYWTVFASSTSGADPVDLLLTQRRRAASYRRPASLVAELRDVAEVMLAASRSMRDRPCRWQGQVFTPGDFLAIWAVEDVVHHLDLIAGAVPAAPLRLARATVDALADVPVGWDDETAVLIGTGRLPAPAGVGGLPAFG